MASLDPAVAHHVDARVLLAHLRQVQPPDLYEIRREFAAYLSAARPRRTFPTWQDAWNAWTGATPQTPGQIQYRTPRCPECRGRGFTTRHIARNMSRTGSPYICAECNGTRRGKQITLTALFIAPPATTTEDLR